MWIDIEHRMHFEYDGWISQSRMELRVQPRTDPHQTLHAFSLAVGPPARVHRYLDWNGNLVHHFGIADYHDRIEATARSVVETHPPASPPGGGSEPPPPTESLGELLDFVRFSGSVAHSVELEALSADVGVPVDAPAGEQVAAIGRLVHRRFRYLPDVTDWNSTTHDLLESGAGVCQDFAHLMLALLRLRGIPSRYVSGYLHASRREPSQSHAWVEWHAGANGWHGFDPTHDQLPDERYVVVGTGRDYHDVAPNRGIYRGTASETLRAEVLTRVTRPRDVAALHEEIAQIDLPVFRDLPARRRPPGSGPAEEQAQQ